MNKWVSVVLCVCGLGLGGMMLTGDSDGGRVLIENAPYITDGKINPDHEGKVVIVAGKLKTEEPAADEELGISFDSPIIRRNVHVMVEKGSGSDIKRSWESMASSNIARMYKSAPPADNYRRRIYRTGICFHVCPFRKQSDDPPERFCISA